MSLIDSIKDYRESKRLKRLEGDLKVLIKKEFEYDPYKVMMPSILKDASYLAQETVENLTWYVGSPIALSEYFKASTDKNHARYFWRLQNARKVHCGIPALISNSMATILFGNGYNYEITMYKESEDGQNIEIDEETSKKAKDLADIVLQEVEMNNKFRTGAEAESWSGHIAFKLSYDLSLSPLPIVEVCDRRSFELVNVRGITKAIVFKHFYVKDKEEYILHEIYTTSEDGNALIKNELYKKTPNKLEQVDLNKIPETEGMLPEVKIGIPGILAIAKPNKIQAQQFIDNPYGVSDYSRSSSTFDSLDEIYTGIVQEMRDNRTMRYIPKTLMPKDDAGRVLPLPEDMTNFTVTEEDLDTLSAGGKVGITTESVQDKTSDNYTKFKTYIAQACNLSGLSPISLGITGLESISSSDKSTRERCKTTIETRNSKIELWKPMMEELILKIMSLASYIQKQYPNSVRAGVPKVDIDYSNCDINVTFADYISNSMEERISTWTAAKQGGIASVEMAVNQLYGDDLTESQKMDEVNRIKFEAGLSTDNPDLLNLGNNNEGN